MHNVNGTLHIAQPVGIGNDSHFGYVTNSFLYAVDIMHCLSVEHSLEDWVQDVHLPFIGCFRLLK